MINQFKPGDSVKLKVNDQYMRVVSLAGKMNEKGNCKMNSYECVWYVNSKLQRAVFSEDVLEWLAPDHDFLHFANYE